MLKTASYMNIMNHSKIFPFIRLPCLFRYVWRVVWRLPLPPFIDIHVVFVYSYFLTAASVSIRIHIRRIRCVCSFEVKYLLFIIFFCFIYRFCIYLLLFSISLFSCFAGIYFRLGVNLNKKPVRKLHLKKKII